MCEQQKLERVSRFISNWKHGLSSFPSFYVYFSRVLKKRKKEVMLQIESDWVWKYNGKLRTNSVKAHQDCINLVFLRSKSTCEENVFLKGGKGRGTIINVKEQ